MARYDDFEDEFARADARERELERQLTMRDEEPKLNSTFENYGNQNTGSNINNSYHAAGQQGAFGNQNIGLVHTPQPTSQAVTRRSGNSKIAFRVVAVIYIFIAVGLLTVMTIVVSSMRNDYKNCTETVEATVVDYKTSIKYSSNNRTRKTTYRPVFSYEYNGETYTQRSSVGTSSPKYQKGEKVTIHIDPNNPKKYYIEKNDKLIMTIIIPIAGFFLLIATIFIIVSIKVKAKPQGTINQQT